MAVERYVFVNDNEECGIDCSARGRHFLAEHNANIRHAYALEMRNNVGYGQQECTCGITGSHSIQEHDEKIESLLRARYGDAFPNVPLIGNGEIGARQENLDPFLFAGLEAAVKVYSSPEIHPTSIVARAKYFADFLRQGRPPEGL